MPESLGWISFSEYALNHGRSEFHSLKFFKKSIIEQDRHNVLIYFRNHFY